MMDRSIFPFKGIKGFDPGQPEMGLLNLVRLVSTTIENRSVGDEALSFQVCNVSLEYNSVQPLIVDDEISPTESNWIREPLLYAHMETLSDCSHYVKHYKSDTEFVLGVRFMNAGLFFYGYVKLRGDDLSDNGCPGSSERWTVIEYGYNKIQGEGLMIH